ncbi:C-reactive protein-like [Leptodactylus fuscus]|uniref:C-reactive protein-like n=1 Tax=Leptodactylus fuscus TaxID=238119 RepID=UPI003F4EF509
MNTAASSGEEGKCNIIVQNMDEDMFTFSKISTDSYVKLFPSSNGPFHELSLCLRFKATLKKDLTAFSLATHGCFNCFRIMFFPESAQQFQLTMTKHLSVSLKGVNLSEWTSVCVSWSAHTGNVTLQIDQNHYEHKLNAQPIDGAPSIIIGQDQDTYGGGFQKSQSFVGDIAGINMWNKTLSGDEMLAFLYYDNIRGNVVTWSDLKFDLKGNVTINTIPCLPIDSFY